MGATEVFAALAPQSIFYGREIHRCVRSAIAAESTAAANLIDVSIWVKMMYRELICGRFFDIRIQEEDPFPLCTPFGPEEIVRPAAHTMLNDNPCKRFWNPMGGPLTRNVHCATLNSPMGLFTR